jgi:hypothetical protein
MLQVAPGAETQEPLDTLPRTSTAAEPIGEVPPIAALGMVTDVMPLTGLALSERIAMPTFRARAVTAMGTEALQGLEGTALEQLAV